MGDQEVGRGDPETMRVYELQADDWRRARRPRRLEQAQRFAARVAPGAVVADLGCGPGWYAAPLGPRAVALDASRAMLDLVPDHAPRAPRVQADLARLPFRRGALGGAWASASYVHLPRRALPMALAELHRALAVDAPADITVFEGDYEGHDLPGDFPGRLFSLWPRDQLLDVVNGAGFTVEAIDTPVEGTLTLRLRRSFTLADTVGPGMRLLLCGLNPSRYAADHGVGFARASNRFWPAMIAAGLADRLNDAFALLYQQRVGLTDLVKRATPRAEEITRDEYEAGFARVERLVEWLQPGAVAFVGLDGWRKVVQRDALPGPAGRPVGGRPAYVLPSTSGLNAHSSLRDLTDHLRAAARLAQNARP